MKMTLSWMISSLVCLTLIAPASAQAPSAHPAYESGYSTIMKIGSAIQASLPPAQRALIARQPVSIETGPTPFIHPLYRSDGDQPIRGVWISAGFIDLVNHLAHAQAIDKIEPGYLDRYLAILATEDGRHSLRPLPGVENPRYWTDEVLNLQLSNFNSIVGTLLGIQLAHHYLGHFDQYRAKLTDGEDSRVPINRHLKPAEWKAALHAGAESAMNAGCMLEGIIPFLQSIDQLSPRPAWADYFLPAAVNPKQIRKDLQNLQRKFFAQEETD